MSMNECTYLGLLRHILKNGEVRVTRNAEVISDFGHHMTFEVSEHFPLLTTKRVFWRGVVEELRWFLSGSTNAAYLENIGVNIWKKWGDPETRELGPIYGNQWRSWAGADGETYDQMRAVINSLKNNPYGRRHIVNAWNVSQLEKMALPPCHMMFQFYVSNDGHLDLQLYQRSADMFLGVPFNIASYSLLLYLMAAEVGLKPRYFHHCLGDAHIYGNHRDAVIEQLSRTPKKLPTLKISDDFSGIFSFTNDELLLDGYDPHPKIKAEVTA